MQERVPGYPFAVYGMHGGVLGEGYEFRPPSGAVQVLPLSCNSFDQYLVNERNDMVASAEIHELAPITHAYAERIKGDPRVIELWERKQGDNVELFLYTHPMTEEEETESFVQWEIDLQTEMPEARFEVLGGHAGMFGPEYRFYVPAGAVRVLPE